MKSIISKTMILVALAATVLSFSTGFGGEGFELFLNNKVMIQQFGKQIDAVSNLRLDQSSSNDQLSLKYYHCGRTGRNRIVSIRDGQNKTVKEWHFNDAGTVMNFNVKDILSLKKTNNNTLQLYYSSTELPNGRLLTNIIVGNNSVAKK
ncbi:MAG: hypothetical protein ABI741_15290 [Ferruginibacter sp.]